MVEITNNNDLTHGINVPTREQNILDLLMTTNPSLISNTEVHPGMSDHQIVIADVDLKAKTAKKKPRKVFLYKKGNMNGLKDNIDAKLSARIDHMSEYTTEDNWAYFKNTITEAMRENIPQKTIGGKQHVPWINTRIKRHIRQKQRRYNAAKKHNTQKNWTMYRQLRDLVRKTMNEAHDEYILNDENEGSSQPTLGKKFWKYIKSRKKDSMGNSPLQSEKGERVIDSKGKAEILGNGSI